MTYCSVACADAKPKPASVPAASVPAASVPAASVPAARKEPKSKPASGAKTGASAAASAAKVVAASSEAKALVEVASVHAAEPSSAPSQRISASRRRRVMLACGAIVVGGTVAIVLSVSPSRQATAIADAPKAGLVPSQANVVPPPVEVAELAAPQDDVPPAAELRKRAVAELEGQLADGSTRFQRLSGMALARIKHAGAITTLAGLLKTENSDLSRIDIAYGLALAGDASGREYLVGELESRRRDVRIDASRRLVQLGDDAGRKALHQMLGVRSHRLGAASVLALLGDEKGLLVLRETFESAKSSDENRMRAAVGLGFAGDALARGHLIEILGEGKYVVDAAGALATLGDRAALPALQRQLLLTALRVGAAESLVSMKEEVDITPLASALLKGNTEGRIAAAEAILVLDP